MYARIGSAGTLMEKLQATSHLRQSFPDFAASLYTHEHGQSADPVTSGHECARFVTALFADADPKPVQHVFDQVEDFLEVAVSGRFDARDHTPLALRQTTHGARGFYVKSPWS